MNYSRKTILIKVTSSIGASMSSNAEYHTLLYFCKWLVNEYNIVVCGIETNSSLIKELENLNVKVRKPLLKYLFFKNFKYFLHIPVSIINSYYDCLVIKPNLFICLGGIFYNGLGVLVAGKLIGVKTLVRSAEDHKGLAEFESRFSLEIGYAKFRAILSGFVIKHSDYFLTIGEWSIKYFRELYCLSTLRSFMVPGPIDNSIRKKIEFLKTQEESRNFLKAKYQLPCEEKTILFIGSNKYKGTNSLFKLIEKLAHAELHINILWITNSNKIKEEVSKLEINHFIRIIRPVGRNQLISILRGVDFLFWSTSLGVGYGQIMLESIICDTEIICYKPIGDARYLVEDNFYSSIDEILDRLKNKIPKKEINIPNFMNEKVLAFNHRKIFQKILET